MAAVATAIPFAPARPARHAPALAERLLDLVLFVTIFLSCIAFIEPSPHDVMMCGLLVACIAARVRFDRRLTPLLMLVVLWLVGGGLSLVQVGDNPKAIQYFLTSVYLGIAGVMYACLFDGGDMVRLAILRRAYILAALAATLTGYVGFFHLAPHSDVFLALSDDGTMMRVSATFKDPNVYGPFLIFPLLILMLESLTRRIRLTGLLAMGFLAGGLLLSFSRGAWMHFAVSAAVAIVMLYGGMPDPRMRMRIIVVGLFAVIALAIVVIALASIPSIHDMLLERAKALQPYDTGPGGRFTLQRLALGAILGHPNGVGPFEFARIYGGQQHDVYMEGFLVYGWLGGLAFMLIVVTTIMISFRNLFSPTPWQVYLIAAFAAFVGEAGEGLIIDSDHWRHLFLLLGLVWGLSVATINWRRGHSLRRTAPAAVRSIPSIAEPSSIAAPHAAEPPVDVRPSRPSPAASGIDHRADREPPLRRDAHGLLATIAAVFEDPD